MGQCCVHYHIAKDFIVFATDLKALLAHPDVPRVLTDAQIGRILMHDRAPREGATVFDGVMASPPRPSLQSASMARSASDATDFFQIPTGRVVEVGTQVTV